MNKSFTTEPLTPPRKSSRLTRYRAHILISSVLLVAVVVLIALHHYQNKPTQSNKFNYEALPDYEVHQFESTEFKDSGPIKYTLQAERLIHYPLNNVTELTQPLLLLHQGTDAPWEIKATSGIITEEGKVVRLEKNVVLFRPSSAHKQALTMKTSSLTVMPDDEHIKTDKPIFIESPMGKLHAIGLRAQLKQGHLHLLSKVKGEYEAK